MGVLNIWAKHGTVEHSADEYVKGSVHTNTVEGYYSIFKRAMADRDLWQAFDLLATVRPFRYDDPETGQTVALSLSPQYATLTVGPRTYYFIRQTGEFDGVSVNAAPE